MRRRSFRLILVHLPERLLLLAGRKHRLDGLKLVVSLQDRKPAELIRAKLTAALALVQQHAPKSYARIKKFTPNILVFGGHAYQSVYVSDLRLCNIDRNYARSEQTTPAQLAATLIHEATHGYLDSLGIKYEERFRQRIERVCIVSEIIFARRLPDPENLIENAVSRLMIGAEFWTGEAFDQRELEVLEAAGTSSWLMAFLREKVVRRAEKRRTLETSPHDSAR